MQRNEATHFTRKTLDDNGLSDWKIRLISDLTRPILGKCVYTEKCIYLNAHHIDTHPDVEVINTINDFTTVDNSKAIQKGQMSDQKVIFKLSNEDITIGEIEMRNDRDVHYKQVKFWMDREKTLDLLKKKINSASKKSDRIIAYGKTVKRFKL